MKLKYVVENLDIFDPDMTIYVDQSWRPDSIAVVCYEPDDGQPPGNYEYFLEVFLLQELIEDASMLTTVERVIEFARNDV
ncbi:hypothetical protein K6689_004256 [Vibrio parahaemolyticus]|nr:hypothetical protein [Vibrio parahaemolyticus]